MKTPSGRSGRLPWLAPPRAQGPGAGGFTLLEILLALALVGLLIGMVILNVPALRGSRTLEEGALRVETALRMARADAANKGRRLRLGFDAQDGQPVVLWEPEPLTQPGEFVEYAGCPWAPYLRIEGAAVESCRFAGASAYRNYESAAVAGGAADAGAAAVTFEPDGSSDSVVILLVATDAPEVRRARIELDGRTGAIDSRILTVEELEALGEAVSY